MIIGSGGAGKSTFARSLGEKLTIPVYHLDQLLWEPNWVNVPDEKEQKIQHNLVQKDKWIIDGNYGSTIDIRLKAADVVIFLDLSRFLCIYRVLKRNIKYRNQSRPDMREGCIEKLDLKFLQWIWQYPRTRKPKIIQKLQSLPQSKKVIILRSRKEVREYLEEIGPADLKVKGHTP